MFARRKRTKKMMMFRPLELDEDQVAADTGIRNANCARCCPPRPPSHAIHSGEQVTPTSLRIGVFLAKSASTTARCIFLTSPLKGPPDIFWHLPRSCRRRSPRDRSQGDLRDGQDR